MSLHLVEVSPELSALQAKNLCETHKDLEVRKACDKGDGSFHYKEGRTKDGVEVFWYHSIQDVPLRFSVFIAQEFFDAMPVHKFQVLVF